MCLLERTYFVALFLDIYRMIGDTCVAVIKTTYII